MWYVEWNSGGSKRLACVGVFNTRAMARRWKRDVTIWEPGERPRVTRNPVTPLDDICTVNNGYWPWP